MIHSLQVWHLKGSSMPYFAKMTLFCNLLQSLIDVLFQISFVQFVQPAIWSKYIYHYIPLNSYHLVPDFFKTKNHVRGHQLEGHLLNISGEKQEANECWYSPTWPTPPHLDFNLVECLAIVHSNHGPNHLRQDDHVSQMGLYNLWLLHGGSLFLGLAQTLQEGLLLAAKAPVQPPPLAGTIQLHQLLAKQKRTSVAAFKWCDKCPKVW